MECHVCDRTYLDKRVMTSVHVDGSQLPFFPKDFLIYFIKCIANQQ
jgi:hypothetical protein